MIKKIIPFILILTFTLSVSGFSMSDDKVLEDTLSFILSTVKEPQSAQTGGEWSVMGAARSGITVPSEFFDSYYNNLIKKLNEQEGILHEKKYTEYARTVLALTAIGKNPENVGGYNLLSFLKNYEKVIFQGSNGAAYALLALDSGNYYKENPVREKYISYILSNQQESGGFSLSGGETDVDVTAMCVQALSKYTDNDNVKISVNRAIDFLSRAQNSDGGFLNFGVDNSESTFQVIMALCELGEDVLSERFIKNGKSLMDNMLSYYDGKGGFYHTKETKAINLMATEQALYTLVNLKRIKEQKPSFYSMTDSLSYESAEKNEDKIYNVPAFIAPKTFTDIATSKNKEAIENLSGRGILNGKTDSEFFPDDRVTRAEFAAIIVRALGLQEKSEIKFADVTANDWFFLDVSICFNYKLISGISESLFAPASFITKQEAATITARTADILNIKNELDEVKIRNILSQFEDYLTCDSWAVSSLAFLYDNDILSQDELLIEPKKEMTRGEIAEIIYRLIKELK